MTDDHSSPGVRGVLADARQPEPSTATEAALTTILRDVLGAERIDLGRSFYELGGHSLLAARVVARVNETIAAGLAIRDLFDAPSMRHLAARIANVAAAQATCSARPDGGPIAATGRVDPLPLSFAQERLWLIDQLEPGSPLYNLAFSVRFSGTLDVDALQASLDAIVERHEPLRTTFGATDGRPFQRVQAPTPIILETTDLTELPDRYRATVADFISREEAVRPFNLMLGPLVRARLLRLEPRQHVLLLAMHHIAADGWSMEVLFRELTTLYASYARSQVPRLPSLPIQYADFATWQRQTLTDDALAPQLDAWRSRLAGAPAAVELLTDRPRPARQTFHGAIHKVFLSAALRDRLELVARAEGATPYMLMLAAYAALLHRYTGQDDLVIGSPSAGRTRADIEGLIGFFVNTLPLRADLAGDPTFRELLGRIREVTLAAQANQDVPLERLIEVFTTERDPSRNPLIQVVLAYTQNGIETIELPGLTLRAEEIPTGSARFDLTLFLERTQSGLTGRIEYNTDLFDPATIERLAGHFETLLEGIAADPGARIAELPILTPSEQSRLAAWNQTSVPFATDRLVYQHVETVAAAHPERLAVVGPSGSLTFDELNRQSNQLAHHLRALGVGAEQRVGICLARSIDLVVAELAVLKAGGAYVPLDPAYPDERRAFMLADAGATVLLTTTVLAADLPTGQAAACKLKIVLIDRDRAQIAQRATENPSPLTTASNLAYVIYTSGSTGLPKGTLIEHRGLLSLVMWHQRAFGVTAGDRATMLAGPAFDASVWEIWSHLTIGATLFIPDDETRTTPTRLRDWLIRRGITVTFLPTPLAEALLALDWPSEAPLRVILTGGDKLHQAPRPGLPFALVNNYGPTETTVVATSGAVAGVAGQAELSPSIGRPLDNTRVYILDRNLRQQPVGVAGELCIGGVGVGRGYLNRPDLTAERFIPDPFSGEPGSRLYRTGDLVRYQPDGDIEFLGRLDHQVKLRGFRIELAEIEAVLAQHSAVRDCLVLAREDRPGQMRLIAYLTPSRSTKPTVAELRSHLGVRLPEYMVPSAFVVLDELPLTPNGKVDRRALPAPEADTSQTEHVAPRGDVEEAVAAIWAEMLKLERVSASSGFFELGGHSLVAIRVVARLRERLKADVPLRALFEAPTLADFAKVVEQASGARAATTSPAIGPISRAAYRVTLTSGPESR